MVYKYRYAEKIDSGFPPLLMSRGERPRYCDADYWEQRYVERPDNFEWYYTYEDILPTIRFVFKPD